jgi:ABC-type Fe3+/spermidine/putrescine transport system ATPase subunit
MSVVLEHLSHRYQGRLLVNDLSLQLQPGELFVLFGDSGSGARAVLQLVAGLLPPTQGSVRIDGAEVVQTALPARRMSYIGPDLALFPQLTVAENVEFPLRVRHLPTSERRLRREMLLELVGLSGLSERRPAHLSRWQQVCVALARALAYPPALLLIEEPFALLDSHLRAEYERQLWWVQRQLAVTTLLATGHRPTAFAIGDRIGLMEQGRLVECGTPEQLYRQPQHGQVATTLEPANLWVGQVTPAGIQIGPQTFVLAEPPIALPEQQHRFQVLVRPEDVALAQALHELGCPALGQGEVESITFTGPMERLRIKLPPLPGVRVIAPSVPYGSSMILVEAARTQNQARTLSLKPGDCVWVGVRRLHGLAHRGFQVLMLPDLLSTEHEQFVAQLMPAIQARTVRLAQATGRATEAIARRDWGPLRRNGGPTRTLFTELERHPYDLVILGERTPATYALAAEILVRGESHLLFPPAVARPVGRTLICVAGGEPGKDDIFFTGRLARHLGSQTTLLTVLPADAAVETVERTRRFLSDGVQTLAVMGVCAGALVCTGPVEQTILQELRNDEYDLLVVGAPLPDLDGRVELGGLLGRLLAATPERAVLIVRAQAAGDG